MKFLQEYVGNWLSVADQPLDDPENSRFYQMIGKLETQLQDSAPVDVNLTPFLNTLSDSYVDRGSYLKDRYFQRGMTYGFMLITGMIHDDHGVLKYFRLQHQTQGKQEGKCAL